MFRYRNSDSSRRVWPSVQRPDGSTLELDPGETVDLDAEVTAAYLERVDPAPDQPTPKPAKSSAKADPASAS